VCTSREATAHRSVGVVPVSSDLVVNGDLVGEGRVCSRRRSEKKASRSVMALHEGGKAGN
jgi:hypothetical protein